MTNVFYSWQADRPTRNGRNFIATALERAAKAINQELQLVEPDRDKLVIDQDTKGVPGSPSIVDTIFSKIDSCTVFVADLTFVGTRPDRRFTPNPNVLIEYGWALRGRGRARIVGVMNTAYGPPNGDSLPFDLRHQRHPVTYHLEEDADDATRTSERDALVADLTNALRDVLAGAPADNANAPLEPFVERKAIDGGGRLVAADVSWGIRVGSSSEMPSGIFLTPGPLAWLRLMPKYVGADGPLVLSNKTMSAIVRATDRYPFDPLVMAREQTFFRREDGFGIYALMDDPSETMTLAVLFSNGEICANDRFLIADQDEEKLDFPAKWYFDALTKYMRVYANVLKIPLPWRWGAGVEGIDGRNIYPQGHVSRGKGPATHDRVVRTGIVDAADVSPRRVLRPFVEAVYDAFGTDAPESLFAE